MKTIVTNIFRMVRQCLPEVGEIDKHYMLTRYINGDRLIITIDLRMQYM